MLPRQRSDEDQVNSRRPGPALHPRDELSGEDYILERRELLP